MRFGTESLEDKNGQGRVFGKRSVPGLGTRDRSGPCKGRHRPTGADGEAPACGRCEVQHRVCGVIPPVQTCTRLSGRFQKSVNSGAGSWGGGESVCPLTLLRDCLSLSPHRASILITLKKGIRTSFTSCQHHLWRETGGGLWFLRQQEPVLVSPVALERDRSGPEGAVLSMGFLTDTG